MCFHTIQSKLAIQIEKRFNAEIREPNLFEPQNHINGFQFPKTPVITNCNPDVIEHYNWGLIPHWAKSEAIKSVTLNAKIETLNEKPSFRDAVTQRCLIIANGFYEWQWRDKTGKNKIKYQIGIENDDLFSFAGLYAHWTDVDSGTIRSTYTIVTTEANSIMSTIHNTKKRMPVILHREDEINWLNQKSVNNFAFPYCVPLVAKAAELDNSLTLF